MIIKFIKFEVHDCMTNNRRHHQRCRLELSSVPVTVFKAWWTYPTQSTARLQRSCDNLRAGNRRRWRFQRPASESGWIWSPGLPCVCHLHTADFVVTNCACSL